MSLEDLCFAVFSILLEKRELARMRALEDAPDDLRWVRVRGLAE